MFIYVVMCYYIATLISIQATTKRSILSSLITNGNGVIQHNGSALLINNIYYQYSR